MSILKALEILYYLLVFILILKFSEGASYMLNNDDNISQNVSTTTASNRIKSNLKECDTGFSWFCMKIELFKIMERLAEKEEVNIFPGISVIKDNTINETKTSEIMSEISRSFPSDPSSRLNGLIVAKLRSILQSRFLRFQLIDSETSSVARSALEEARKGKFHKKSGMEAIIAAVVMMKGTLLAIGMGALALMTGKALIAALMALTLSAAVGLKGLAHSAGGGGKSTTYEIVAKPIYTSSHSHSVNHDDGHFHNGPYGHPNNGYGNSYARSAHFPIQSSNQIEVE